MAPDGEGVKLEQVLTALHRSATIAQEIDDKLDSLARDVAVLENEVDNFERRCQDERGRACSRMDKVVTKLDTAIDKVHKVEVDVAKYGAAAGFAASLVTLIIQHVIKGG